MQTIVYVDGYNLFYSLLTKTPYKWLDLGQLFARLVRPIEPTSEVALIKYFTAPILGRMVSDPRAEQRQAHCHRALKAVGGIEIVKGFHIGVASRNGKNRTLRSVEGNFAANPIAAYS